MRRVPLRHLIAGLVLAWATMPARAQVGMTFDSLEWMAARATAIVRAEVFDVSVLPRGENGVWFRALLRVRETLKGSAAEEVAYYAPGWRGQAHPLETLTGECLWFLGPWPAMNNGPAPEQGAFYAYQEWAYQAWFSLDDSEPCSHKVFTMDLQVLDDAGQILELTRSCCASQADEPVLAVQFEIPREVALRTGRAGDANGLVVPRVPRLEALAVAWLRCEADWFPLPAGSESWQPEQLQDWRGRAATINGAQTIAGLRAIRSFRSERTIELVRACSQGDGYPADEARRILAEWGLDD